MVTDDDGLAACCCREVLALGTFLLPFLHPQFSFVLGQEML